MYTITFYYVTTTVASVGYGDIVPGNTFEMLVSGFIQVIGALFFGFYVATLAADISTAGVRRSWFKHRLDTLVAILKYHSVDPTLVDRAIRHQLYVWRRNHGMPLRVLFQGLPHSIQGDLNLDVSKEIISKVSLFEGTDLSFKRMLSKYLEHTMYVKGEYICKRGDISEEIYLIQRGTVEIISPEEDIVFDTLITGDSFGEEALLNKGNRRVLPIRAHTNCDIYSLSKTDLSTLLESYPSLKQTVHQVAHMKLIEARNRFDDHVAATSSSEGSSLSSSQTMLLPREDFAHRTRVATIPSAQCRRSTASVASPHSRRSSFFMTSLDEEIEEDEQQQDDLEETAYETGRIAKLKWLWRRFVDKRTIVDSDHKMYRIYRDFMYVVGILSFFVISYHAAFQDHSVLVYVITYSCDLIYYIEMFVIVYVGYYDPLGNLVMSPRLVLRHYTRNPIGLIVDAVVNFPVEIFACVASTSTRRQQLVSVLRLPRIFRSVRMCQYYANKNRVLDVNTLRSCMRKFCVQLFFTTHLFTCCWYVTGCPFGNCLVGSWATQLRWHSTTEHFTLAEKYVASMYFVIATMTTTGYGDITPKTVLEMIVANTMMITGKFIIGLFVANIATTLAHLSMPRSSHEQRMTIVKEHMLGEGVDRHVRSRMEDYFNYAWRRHGGCRLFELVQELPFNLRAEINLHLARSMFKMTPFVQDVADDGFYRMLSCQVRLVICLPDDYIVYRHDFGHHIYYIHSGTVDVIEDENQPWIVTHSLTTGDMFGANNVHACVPFRENYRANGYVDLLTLSKESLDATIKSFADIQASKENFDEMSSHHSIVSCILSNDQYSEEDVIQTKKHSGIFR